MVFIEHLGGHLPLSLSFEPLAKTPSLCRRLLSQRRTVKILLDLVGPGVHLSGANGIFMDKGAEGITMHGGQRSDGANGGEREPPRVVIVLARLIAGLPRQGATRGRTSSTATGRLSATSSP